MRNLKRTLSLLLSAAMLIGMMVISASAVSYEDFTDADEIQHTEAVSVLTTLNVIAGKDDGSYDPTGSLTRAEMAKIVAYVMNGGVEPNIGTKVTPTYSDIDGHWAESYIEYCTSMGIIAGDGAGRFNPEATLTASQTAKMFLTAMGYNAEVFGFVGNDWEINANRYANEAGLYNDLGGLIPSQPISRDAAAQMAYNAIQAYMMERDWSQDQTTGQITEGYRLSTTKTLLSERFGVIKVEGVVTANEFTNGSSMSGKTQVDVTNWGNELDQNVFNDGRYNVSTGADEIGKNVTLYVKPYSNGNTNISRATVLGGAIINDNNTIYTTTGALVDDSTKSNDVTETLDDQGLEINGDVTIYTNYKSAEEKNPTAADLVNTKGVEAQYIDNDNDGTVDVVVKVAKAFGKVSVYSEAGDGRLTITNLSNVDAEGKLDSTTGLATSKATDDVYDFANLDLEKDDYVYFYKVNDLYYVELAEPVTAAITATKDKSIYADDTEYTLSGLASKTDISAESGNQADLVGAVTVGEDAVLYLDAGNNVIYVTEVETTSSYLMVTAVSEATGFSDTVSARVVLEDGTTATVEINRLTVGDEVTNVNNSTNAGKVRDSLKAATIDKETSGKIYSYTVTSDNEYNLTKVDTKVAKDEDLVKGNPAVATGIVANNATKFVVSNDEGTSYTAYTGINNVAGRDGADMFAVLGTNNIAKVIFTYEGTGATDSSNYMYVLSATPYVTKDGDNDVYTYTVIHEGEVTTVEGDAIDTFGTDAGLYIVTISGDKATGGTRETAGTAEIASEGVLKVGSKTYSYNDDTVFFLIEGDEESDVTEVGAESVITTAADAENADSVSVVVDSSDPTVVLYVFIERG